MILMHDQQNPLTTSHYILYAPKPSCNIQHAKIDEITREGERERLMKMIREQRETEKDEITKKLQ